MPVTIGEHVRKRRIELRLEQVEVARQLGVHRGSVQNWERNRGVPTAKQMPAIIRLLRYVPFELEHGFGGRLAFLRKCVGLTQVELSVRAGCARDLIGRWERMCNPPRKTNLESVLRTLDVALETQGIDVLVGSVRFEMVDAARACVARRI